jgi:hypothetical protein
MTYATIGSNLMMSLAAEGIEISCDPPGSEREVDVSEYLKIVRLDVDWMSASESVREMILRLYWKKTTESIGFRLSRITCSIFVR